MDSWSKDSGEAVQRLRKSQLGDFVDDACAVVDNAFGVIHRCAGISQNKSSTLSTKTDKETPISH